MIATPWTRTRLAVTLIGVGDVTVGLAVGVWNALSGLGASMAKDAPAGRPFFLLALCGLLTVVTGLFLLIPRPGQTGRGATVSAGVAALVALAVIPAGLLYWDYLGAEMSSSLTAGGLGVAVMMAGQFAAFRHLSRGTAVSPA